VGSGAPAWSRSRCGAGSGRVVPPTNDVVLNALRGVRFCEVWWAGLTLRGATAAALAGGALWTVPSRLGDRESYTGVGLGPGESQLLASLTSTRQLLAYAEDLARAVTLTPAEVAQALSADAATASGAAHAAVVRSHLGGLLAPGGMTPPPSPGSIGPAGTPRCRARAPS